MLKFISLKDPHLSLGFQNRIRIDYQRDILQKLEFLKSYISTNNINGIIFTGDITDSNYDKKWSFRQYVKNKRAFQSLKVSDETLIMSPVGNHDMFNGVEDSYDTVFDELVKESVIINITDTPRVFEPVNSTSTTRVKIYGVNFSNNKETIRDALRAINLDSFLNINYYKIVVMHNNLTPETEQLTEFRYDELVEEFPNINMFIAGHYHIGFPTKKIKDTVFINNWNLTRVVRDYKVTLDKHTPEFEEIIFDDELKLISTKTIKIPFRPFEETFIPNIENVIKKSKQEIFEFFNIDFEEIISKQSDEEILNQFDYDPKIITLAMKYLND